MNWKLISCVALLSYGAYHHLSQRAVKHGAGEVAPNSPIQTDSHVAPIQVKDFTLIPLADYNIVARVLSREDYTFDAGASLSPTDLAVGWGPMSHETVLNKMDISQNNRFFFGVWIHCRFHNMRLKFMRPIYISFQPMTL